MSALRQALEVTDEEWIDMMRLYRQINCSLTTSTVDEMERFSDLFVRTLAGKGNSSP
jgi:hypothetical protein